MKKSRFPKKAAFLDDQNGNRYAPATEEIAADCYDWIACIMDGNITVNTLTSSQATNPALDIFRCFFLFRLFQSIYK